VVASTDDDGAKILEKRIREQLEHSQELKTGCVFQVATAELDLPPQESGESIEQLVQKVAHVITEIAMLKLQRNGNSNGHAKNIGNLDGQQTIKGRIL
jgi:hypothetical protein